MSFTIIIVYLFTLNSEDIILLNSTKKLYILNIIEKYIVFRDIMDSFN